MSVSRGYPVSNCSRFLGARAKAPEARFRRIARPLRSRQGLTTLAGNQQLANGRFDEQQAVLSRHPQRRPAAPAACLARPAQPVAGNAGAARSTGPREDGAEPIRAPPTAPPAHPPAGLRRPARWPRSARRHVQTRSRYRPALPGDRPRHRPRARPGRRRRRRRQDRRRTARPARGTAPPDDGRPAARIRHAARGHRARLCQAAAGSGAGAELGAEIERLSGAIQSLAERSDDKSVNLLRLELEQVQARARTRWRARRPCGRSTGAGTISTAAGATSRTASMPTPASAGDPDLAAPDRPPASRSATPSTTCPNRCRCARSRTRCARLPAPSTISSRQQDARRRDASAMIEERLDEISRAIVASTVAAQSPHFDPEPFERIEARISALARQIEEVADDRPTGEVIDRLNMLSSASTTLPRRSRLPEQAIERLAQPDRADRRQDRPARRHARRRTRSSQGIEQRFDVLSDVIERRQGDAHRAGNMLFRDLERRLDEVADRLDRASRRARSTSRHHGRDRRALHGARRSGSRRSSRTAPTRRRSAGWKPGSKTFPSGSTRRRPVRRHRSRPDPQPRSAGRRRCRRICRSPSAPLPEFEDIGPRLDEIEKSIAGSRDIDPRGGAPGGRERRALAAPARQADVGRRLRPRAGPEGAGSADAPFRRAQRQDLRGDPRHAAEDRRPARLAGSDRRRGRRRTTQPAPPAAQDRRSQRRAVASTPTASPALDEPLQRADSTVARADRARTSVEPHAGGSRRGRGRRRAGATKPLADASTTAAASRSMLGGLDARLQRQEGSRRAAPAGRTDLPDAITTLRRASISTSRSIRSSPTVRWSPAPARPTSTPS